ncbi:hypothetical protein ACSVDE_16830 [Pseudalkalibacillus sp. Hm43]|uniref:hypothetical protein n=1 Tax=Pseudalkalibacillus sp. Hm43 TaxID=3450742 RepID=UPI003F43AEB9
MKRFIHIIVILFVISILASCSPVKEVVTSKKNITIQPAQLSDENKNLLNAIGGDMVFVFDVDLNKQPIKRMNLFVEHYKSGVKVDNEGEFGAGITQEVKNKRIAFTIANPSVEQANQNLKRVYFTYSDENGYSRAEQYIESAKSPSSSSWGQQDQKMEVQKDQPVNLAFLIETAGDSLEVRADLLSLEEEELKEAIADYDHFYLFRAEFLTTDFDRQ